MITEKELNEFLNRQLKLWDTASANYAVLDNCQERSVTYGDFVLKVRLLPSRVKSSQANISAKAIKERPCFLCSQHRPKEQIHISLEDNLQLLVNPYPIFNPHFTIASTSHEDQKLPLEKMARLATQLEGMTIFFNGSKAGASAPDHLHLQAVRTSELPLIDSADQLTLLNDELRISLHPFLHITGVLKSSAKSCVDDILLKVNEISGNKINLDQDSNVYCWKNKKSGQLRFIIIPRRNHRPELYFMEDPYRRMFSPGAVDMAGVFIATRQEDYENLTVEEINKIFSDVALT